MIAYTHVEDYVNELYESLSIKEPYQLDIDHIAKKLRLQVHYGDFSFKFDNKIVIRKSTKQREWQSFGHEICHFLRHIGSHLSMNYLFRDLQEYQANHFSYHFCVPTFMLRKLKEVSVDVIMNLFNVEFNFAVRRLEMYKNKVLNGDIYVGAR